MDLQSLREGRRQHPRSVPAYCSSGKISVVAGVLDSQHRDPKADELLEEHVFSHAGYIGSSTAA